MDPQSIGVIGSAFGVLGGVVGAYFGVRRAAAGRERAFLIRASVVCWLFVTGFLAALWLTPQPYQPYLWLPYSLLLPSGIAACNRWQERIRREGAGAEPSAAADPARDIGSGSS